MWKQGTEILLSASARVQQGPGWHMHDGGYMFGNSWGWGTSLIHTLLWLLVLTVISGTTLLLARKLGGGGTGNGDSKTALDRLDERYANGEIDREEYLQRKNDIMER